MILSKIPEFNPTVVGTGEKDIILVRFNHIDSFGMPCFQRLGLELIEVEKLDGLVG